MNYIVSGHGGRWETPTHEVWLPEHLSVNFFVNDGEIISNQAAWPIYNHLLAGDEKSVQGKIVRSVPSGEKAYNYSCWYYPELGRNSGVFKVGAGTTDNPIIDLSYYTSDNPLTLDAMFDLLPEPGVIYWVTCQSMS
ncbi:putative adhesin [Marinomonas sp. TW1]|uniref:putative adhesin n=1 Tax=Marinomonas sp. TW1 TaxID=1561203 RepID=UPI0007AFA220|nr:hypothetical protein [Marinomonas sp. TW1]KZN12581.1 hypothetical protein OA79_14970 [Marinomonas sp. TW1]